jgi:hypothetical protein
MSSGITERIRRIRDEIIKLSKRQTEMLRLARFGGMSQADVEEYDERHKLIMKLVKEFARFSQPQLFARQPAREALNRAFLSQPVAFAC